MQSVSANFDRRSKAQMRPISWGLKMSFEKNYDESVTFFKLDSSLLNGPDILKSINTDVIQGWDKYDYQDYSDRVVSIEWGNEFTLPDSISMAIADLVLDNHDNFFTPGSGSSIADYVLPRRPLRLYAGFGGELLPVFVGLTEKMPTIDQTAKTVSFHCIDFLASIFDRPLDESLMYVNLRTDQILEDLFENVGVLSSQIDLDTGANSIPFAYFEKGTKLGDAVKKLMQAEMGRLYMNELGRIRFKNRYTFSDTPVATFDDSNTVSRERSNQDDIINVVEITAKPRAVEEKQPVYQSTQVIEIKSGGTGDIWADLPNPVTDVDAPSLGFSIDTSYYIARKTDASDGIEVVSGVSTTSFDVFATSAKATVSNSNAFTVYITEAEFWGTPAKVIGGDDNQIYLRKVNDESVEKYDEHVLTIENDFIQSENEALSIASFVLYRQATLGTTYNLDVKGSPAQQLDDAVTINDGSSSGTYVLMKHENRIGDGRYQQQLRATYVKPLNFFRLDHSLLNGPDVLAF